MVVYSVGYTSQPYLYASGRKPAYLKSQKGAQAPAFLLVLFFAQLPVYVCIYTTLPLWGGLPKGVVCMHGGMF